MIFLSKFEVSASVATKTTLANRSSVGQLLHAYYTSLIIEMKVPLNFFLIFESKRSHSNKVFNIFQFEHLLILGPVFETH